MRNTSHQGQQIDPATRSFRLSIGTLRLPYGGGVRGGQVDNRGNQRSPGGQRGDRNVVRAKESRLLDCMCAPPGGKYCSRLSEIAIRPQALTCVGLQQLTPCGRCCGVAVKVARVRKVRSVRLNRGVSGLGEHLLLRACSPTSKVSARLAALQPAPVIVGHVGAGAELWHLQIIEQQTRG